jgi:ATP synthase H subunit
VFFPPTIEGEFVGSSDVLRGIKEAETEASKILQEAKDKAVQTLTDARIKSAEILKEAKQSSQASAASSLDEAKQGAAKEADKVAAEGGVALETIHSSGESKRQEAIEIVLSSFAE